MKSFDEANRAIAKTIASLGKSSIYTLDRIQRLLTELDDPQEKFKTIHIAGTSGKTSTAYYAAAMLKAAGFKTGLSVSPHINEINDRVQIDSEPVEKQEFLKNLEEFITTLNKLSVKPTYFEFFISFAYWYFAKTGVEYAVIETGLGGLLDGTNVINREDKVCVITDIGLDHTKVLGDNLRQIAAQKAGIIKPGNQVFMHRQSDEINKIIIEKARKQGAHVRLIADNQDDMTSGLPDFQQRNWSLAKAACEYVLKREDKRLSRARWQATTAINIPGRMEIMKHGDKLIVLDGAHNSQKIRSFIHSYKARFNGKPTAVLFGVAKGRQAYLEAMAEELGGISDNIIISNFGVTQDVRRNSLEAGELARYFSGSVRVEPDLKAAVDTLLRQQEDVLLVTGSLYLVSAVKKILGQS